MVILPEWSANGGVIDANGMYNATVSGEFTVTATEGVLQGVASVTVTDAVTVIDAIDVRVSGSSDDAEESGSGGVSLGSSDLELVYTGSNQTVGIRFKGVEIPQGASISGAYVQFQVDENSSDVTVLELQGEAVDDALTFSSTSWDISSRARTAATVNWTPAPWPNVGEAGDNQQTPDIASVIEEIVGRPGWQSGNSLAIIISGSGKRVAESHEGVSAAAPLLHVEYTTASPAPPVLTNIVVTPDLATVAARGTQAFSAAGYDQYGGPVGFTSTWTATGGTIDSDIRNGNSNNSSTTCSE
jgi:hypothetical protein